MLDINQSQVNIHLGPVYGKIFGFPTFNRIQSKCYYDVMDSDCNIIVSAPTGSGKTGILELAVVKMIKDKANGSQMAKAVYLAPTKALCTEKSNSFQKKFQPLQLKCSELTGDTEEASYNVLNNSDIM